MILAFNRIDRLDNLSRAPHLTIIDLHNNKLELLPDDVVDLRKLKTLKVSNNDLSDLNPRLALLGNLVRINIEGNPLKCIKTSLRGAGAEPLKQYLKLRLSETEISKDEITQGIATGVPGANSQYDAWDTFLREFVQGGQTLDLRNKVSKNVLISNFVEFVIDIT